MWNKTKELWNYFLFRLDPYRRLEARWRDPLEELLGLLAPERVEGVAKIRVGAPHDGGYVMLDDFREISGAYSLGIGPDVRWDLALAQRGVPVWQYDPTVPGPPASDPLFTFQPWRIGTLDDPETQTVSLASLIEMNKHQGADLILKMDIEGAEWEVFAGIDPDLLRVFRQIVVELHSLHRVAEPDWHQQATSALTHLTRHHQVVHVHGNNLSSIVVAGDLRITESLEVTLARRNAYSFVATEETFPGAFDRANSWVFPDFPLGTFRYGAASRKK
ncbi:MAG: FkbM family methyltransferase [Methylacidiphilales bacterium]|nr:FkbM family methyltransferase [Candidatus Methylacidiphilales bacterium]